LLKKPENGSPLSRAKAKPRRELWAQRKAKLIKDIIEIWKERAMPAAKDLVEDSKIWKIGTLVGELAAASMSTMQP
jgi:hypothetical protein